MLSRTLRMAGLTPLRTPHMKDLLAHGPVLLLLFAYF